MQNYIKNLEKVFIVRNAARTKSGMILIDYVKPKILKKKRYITAYEKLTGTKTELFKIHGITPDKGYKIVRIDVLIADDSLTVPVMEKIKKGVFAFAGQSIQALQTDEYIL
ncbi:MAG: hypothetical protein RBR08_11310 [Desulforegulaceae bacterium]|nr:hypothetical protein [Desulforegulaceae bacterium]